MLKVLRVIQQERYLLRISFDDGVEKLCDIEPMLESGDFIELKEMSLFASVRPIVWGIEWQNGLDLSADTLYAIGNDIASKVERFTKV